MGDQLSIYRERETRGEDRQSQGFCFGQWGRRRLYVRVIQIGFCGPIEIIIELSSLIYVNQVLPLHLHQIPNDN